MPVQVLLSTWGGFRVSYGPSTKELASRSGCRMRSCLHSGARHDVPQTAWQDIDGASYRLCPHLYLPSSPSLSIGGAVLHCSEAMANWAARPVRDSRGPSPAAGRWAGRHSTRSQRALRGTDRVRVTRAGDRKPMPLCGRPSGRRQAYPAHSGRGGSRAREEHDLIVSTLLPQTPWWTAILRVMTGRPAPHRRYETISMLLHLERANELANTTTY
jgi:hypothetical protein